MKITIFGATGAAGQVVVNKALDKGYNVKVYARTPSKITLQHTNLEIIKGEMNDYEAVSNAIKGADAVISLLGPTGSKVVGLPIVEATKNIVKAMEEQGVNRLVATSTASFKDKNDKYQFSFSVAVFMIKTLAGNVYQNVIQAAQAIVDSKLDWTIVRLPMLSKEPASGKIAAGYIGDGKVKLFLKRHLY